MIISNLQIHPTILFDEYLALPGYSYSGIKNDGNTISPSKKMQLGTQVHNYLLTPREYNYDNHEIVKPCADAVRAKLGPLLKYLRPELAVQADFIHNGFRMPYKGRIDLCITERIVIDIKVSEMPLHKAVAYFGYNDQLSGYSLAIGAKVAIIISINPKTKVITTMNIPITSRFWEYHIQRLGEPIK